MKVLITAGPTYEPIDPIRFIGNRSTGSQGALIADKFSEEGWDVTLVSGPNSRLANSSVSTIHVGTASEMLEACLASLPVDVAICTAAVADYCVSDPRSVKWSKSDGAIPDLKLSETPDILATLSIHRYHRPRLVIGFAGETYNIQQRARQKLARKQCDFIFSNDISPGTGALGGGPNNQVSLIGHDGVIEEWEIMTKKDIADRIFAFVKKELEK